MSMALNMEALYKGKMIGVVEVLQAWENGWISETDKDRILSIQVAYSLSEAVKFKLKELSAVCTKSILNGIDVVLSDGTTQHFSLSEKDQINLAAKMLNVGMGATQLEYHSDGEPCIYYSAEDMATICTMAQHKVTVETTYHNCLKQWVKGCTSPEEVMAISYGSNVPEEYWSEPWRNIVTQMSQVPGDGTENDDDQGENTSPEEEPEQVGTDVESNEVVEETEDTQDSSAEQADTPENGVEENPVEEETESTVSE